MAAACHRSLAEVAMGQGQAEKALASLRQAASEGQWVCLKNLHLMTFWIPVLEKELQAMEPHDNFRYVRTLKLVRVGDRVYFVWLPATPVQSVQRLYQVKYLCRCNTCTR